MEPKNTELNILYFAGTKNGNSFSRGEEVTAPLRDRAQGEQHQRDLVGDGRLRRDALQRLHKRDNHPAWPSGKTGSG